MTTTPKELDLISDVVLNYKPKENAQSPREHMSLLLFAVRGCDAEIPHAVAHRKKVTTPATDD